MEEAINKINNFKNDLYVFTISKTEELTIKTNGYNGFGISISTQLVNLNIKLPFSIDIAIEELGNTGLVRIDDMDVYSIERTLADKFVSMIQWGSMNGREKDFIDLKNLFNICNKEEFYLLSKLLLVKRKVTDKEISLFISSFTSFIYIKKYSLTSIVKELINKILITK